LYFPEISRILLLETKTTGERKMENVTKNENFNQVCVWPSTVVSEDDVSSFTQFFQDTFGARVQFLEDYRTLPDREDGLIVEDTGGRADALFAVHADDVAKFAIPRLQFGIRWIEDAIDNSPEIYAKRITKYRTW